jgi:hypothetical protein
MALVLLEGLDRTGKSTVAAYFETLGFEKIHLSAPAKGTTSDQYMQEMADLISSAATKDIVLDRTHYGELIWPQIFGRKPLLDEEMIEALREIEDSVGTQRIWMTDDDIKAHWQRCVDNKEPLDKAQFTRTRGLYSTMAQKYGFEKVTLQTFVKQFPEAQAIVDKMNASNLEQKTLQVTSSGDKTTVTEVDAKAEPVSTTHVKYPPGKTPEQHKLEVANAINEILSKRILKSKGIVYDDLENEMRHFLNAKLGKLLGGASSELSLTQEEVRFYKEMYKRAKDKGVN